MTTEKEPSPKIHAQFEVSSGHLCYGELHNIWHGASCDHVQGLPFTDPKLTGTVMSHGLDYNIPATKGTWNAYRLLQVNTLDAIMGWFVAHADVNPRAEIDRILRVSGSPYERDSGSSMNCKRTAAEGVFVINRSDWGYCDSRCEDEIKDPDVVESGEGDFEIFEAVGLVDYEQAKEQVSQWSMHRSRSREDNVPSSEGIWLHIPGLEYKFGRFGFDEAQDAAHSFIFFTTNTYFDEACLDGIPETIRAQETAAEFFERKIREDPSFYDGFEMIYRLASSTPGWDAPRQPPAELSTGPHERTSYVVEEQDLGPLFGLAEKSYNPKPVRIWSTRKDETMQLLNELVLTYLTNSIKPLCSAPMSLHDALDMMAQNPESLLVSKMREYFTEPDQRVGNFDIDLVATRIKRFLISPSTSRTEGRDDSGFLPDNPDFMTGLAKAIGYMLSEILQLASMTARDCGHLGIIPRDIRLAVINDKEILQLIGGSWVFWNGERDEAYVPEDPFIEINRKLRAENAAKLEAKAQGQRPLSAASSL